MLTLKLTLKPRIAAVSYLNTAPLVWGMMHGPQRGLFDLDFCVPSECAQRVEAGRASLGILPVMEMRRLGFDFVPGTGIACRGAVRSILLVSKREPSRIRTLVTDSGSRTSVMLSRIVLAERYGVTPEVWSREPDLEAMLEQADAALLIGDAALRADPAALPYRSLDLGAEWEALTGLPMVFALWSGRPGAIAGLDDASREAFAASLAYGRQRMDEIVASESRAREFPAELVRQYLTRFIVFGIGPREREGMDAFFRLAAGVEAHASANSQTVLSA